MTDVAALANEWRKQDLPARWHRWRGRIKIPHNCHPLVKKLFEEANAQKTTPQEIADRAGITRVAISEWRNRKNPSIVTFEAALNVLGLELCIRKQRS